jgi:hypothetical protein
MGTPLNRAVAIVAVTKVDTSTAEAMEVEVATQ